MFNNTNRVQGRTSLSPSQSLQINLTWNVDWSEGENLSYRPVFDDMNNVFGIDTTRTRSGNSKASVWAFRASYLDMFEEQLDTYVGDLEAADDPSAIILADENNDGRVVLTNRSVSDDFRSTYIGT